MKKKKAPPSSSFFRAARLASTGAAILAKEIGGRAKSQFHQKVDEIKAQTRVQQVRILTDALSQLKGSAMKFGQLLSFEAQDLLPQEALEILARLQKNAEPIERSVLFSVVQSELGQDKFQDLNLELEPIATASIGQVYRGHLKGQDIAVKVQFPKVKESIGSDMNVLRGVTSVAMTLFGKKVNLNDLMEELETVLTLETDYLREKRNLSRYGEILLNDKRFVVPRPIPEYSSAKVLTMSYAPGVHLRDWIATRPPMEERLAVGQMILDLYILEFFRYGIVQTDPNLANFMVQEPGPRLVLLDFGAVLEYSKEFVQMYRKLIGVLLDRSEKDIIAFAEDQGLLDSRETVEVKSLFVNMVSTSVLPFKAELQPFDFANKDYSQQVRQSVIDFSRSAKYTKPPREFIFLHRKLGGIFHIMKMLELKIDLGPFWQKAFKD